MTDRYQKLLDEARTLLPKLVDVRRAIHRHPELGMEEYETSRLIREKLADLDVPFAAEVGGTPAVVGELRGELSGPCIALRADMDALPIQERNDVEYRSTVPGKMHACGHDGHVAALLGAAELLQKHRSELRGTVKLFFQPAEENPGGAKPMVEAGVMDNPRVNAVIGQHLGNHLEVGRIALRPGPIYAAADSFQVRLTGSGGHGAHPERTVDALVCGAHLVTILQTISSREVSPLQPVVVTVGTFRAGYGENIIADEALLTGTVRTTDMELRRTIEDRIRRLSRGVAEAFRCEVEVNYVYGTPPGLNDEALTHQVRETAERLLGSNNIVEGPITMGAEDFAFFAQRAPGVFIGLGSGNPARGLDKPGHHPGFDFDETALSYGAALFAAIAIDYLND